MTETIIPAPSPWITRFHHLIPKDGNVLDLACGSGRHGRLFLKQGQRVSFLDQATQNLQDLADHPQASILEIDLENGQAWPLGQDIFDAIIVTNYLYRPHLKNIIQSLKPGGILLYETFALGNERYGRPHNPDFLLEPGELLHLAQGRLHVIAYEHGLLEKDGASRIIQRICANRPSALTPDQPHPLHCSRP